MLDALNNMILHIMAPVLDWMLALPRWTALLIVALLTALVLTLVRLVATNQEYLGRCKRDKDRLKELLGEAKRAKDKDARTRIRATMGQIGMQQMKAEGWPLLASIVPIALLAVWAFSRLAFLPAVPGEAVTVRATFPVSEIGQRVHMLPQDGVTAEGGWIGKITEDVADGEVTNGVATWTLKAERRDKPYQLKIRFGGRTFEKELWADGRHYAAPVVFYDDPDIHAVDVALTEYKPFGFVPGIKAIAIQPWILGYLLIVLPLSFVLKPVLRIH